MQADRYRVEVVVEQIGVCVEGDLRGLVAKHALQRKHIHARRYRQRRARMPQIVRSDLLDLRPLDGRLKPASR